MSETRGRGRPRLEKRAEISDDLEKLALSIIDKDGRWLGFQQTDIIFLECYGFGGTEWLGRCRPIKHPFDAILPAAKYIVEFNMDKIEGANFDDEQKRLLMFHELLHIPETGLDPESPDFKKLTKHNLTEFAEVLVDAGVDYFDWREESPADRR